MKQKTQANSFRSTAGSKGVTPINAKGSKRKARRVAAHMFHAHCKSNPAIWTTGSLQRFFSKSYLVWRWQSITPLWGTKRRKTFRHLSMQSTGETEPLSSEVGTVLRTVDDRALNQIRLPMLKMSSHQKSQMHSILLSSNSTSSVEHQSGPANRVAVKVNNFSASFQCSLYVAKRLVGRAKRKAPQKQKCCRDLHLLPWNWREQILKHGGSQLVYKKDFPSSKCC